MKILSKSKINSALLLTLSLSPLIVNFFLATWANLDNSEYKYVLASYDEGDTAVDIFNSLKAMEGGSFKEIFYALFDQDYYLYGRLMMYFNALVSYIPFKYFGESSIVISIRMTQTVILILSYYILGMFFLNTKLQRFVFWLCVCTLRAGVHYNCVPKPEPFQILFLALFFIFLFKKRYSWSDKFKDHVLYVIKPAEFYYLDHRLFGHFFKVKVI